MLSRTGWRLSPPPDTGRHSETSQRACQLEGTAGCRWRACLGRSSIAYGAASEVLLVK
jgi:hypothetical protein